MDSENCGQASTQLGSRFGFPAPAVHAKDQRKSYNERLPAPENFTHAHTPFDHVANGWRTRFLDAAAKDLSSESLSWRGRYWISFGVA